MKLKTPIYAVFCGVALTLLTGLFSNTPPGLVGAVWYGYPLPWLFRMIIAPQYFPWRVDTLNLVADIILWSIIVGIAILILKYTRK
ncbi:MAG: hypothetical protein QXN62_08690 [Candidatus Bathyarchaeia archaeon]|nr:hypothetical protein [Candidatus Bathyarchaeota archaeon]